MDEYTVETAKKHARILHEVNIDVFDRRRDAKLTTVKVTEIMKEHPRINHHIYIFIYQGLTVNI